MLGTIRQNDATRLIQLASELHELRPTGRGPDRLVTVLAEMIDAPIAALGLLRRRYSEPDWTFGEPTEAYRDLALAGPLSGAQLRAVVESWRRFECRDPGLVQTALRTDGCSVFMREELVDDQTWLDSRWRGESLEAIDMAEKVYAAQELPTSPGWISVVCATRASNQPRFGAPERDILAVVNSTLVPIVLRDVLPGAGRRGLGDAGLSGHVAGRAAQAAAFTGTPAPEIEQAVEAPVAGPGPMPVEVDASSEWADSAPARRLTPAQRNLLPYLLEGMAEEEIARKLFRSRHTVHDHIKRIYHALGVRSRLELVLKFRGETAGR